MWQLRGSLVLLQISFVTNVLLCRLDVITLRCRNKVLAQHNVCPEDELRMSPA